MKFLIATTLLCIVIIVPSQCSVVDKFKEFEIVPDILKVAPEKILEVCTDIELLPCSNHRRAKHYGNNFKYILINIKIKKI